VAGAVIVAGPVVSGAHAWAATTVSPPAIYENLTVAPDCSSDAGKPLQAWLQQLPSGSTVDLMGACYQVDHGITLRFMQGLTIENGTFQDLNATPEVNKGHGTPRGQPVFDVLGGSGVSFENLIFIGVNPGGYHPRLAFQAAIELDGTIGASMSGLTISKTFGDGINLEPLRGGFDHKSGQIINPAENISITNVVIRGAGRQGITLASVNGVTISNVTMTNIADDAFDFEADQNNEGAKNVVINGCSFSQLFNISMQGAQTGPIMVENCVMPEADSGWALNINNTSGGADAGPVTFNHDVFNCGASVYVACFDLVGATNLVIENSRATIGYPRDQIHEHAYRAINNSNVSFIGDTVSGYGTLGSTSTNSFVSFVGGLWSPMHSGPTTTALIQSTGTVAYGLENADTFAVTVAGVKDPAPTGTVTVSDLATQTPICMATLVVAQDGPASGSCSPQAGEFDGGTSFTDVVATYYGDGNYSDSQSAPAQSFTVGAVLTSTTLSQSTGTVVYGSENVDNFVATVTNENGGTAPDGWVTIDDAATGSPICLATLVNYQGNSARGTCDPTATEFPAETSWHSVTATYAGDENNLGSVSSPALTFVVGQASTATTLSQTNSTVAYGSESAVTFMATVTGPVAGTAPTGTVSVADGATRSPVCTMTLVPNPGNSSTGACSPTETQFPAGTALSSVKATYAGDQNNRGSVSSPALTFVVGQGSSATTLSQTNSTVAYGSESADTFTATVTGPGAGTAPTGTVSVADAATGSTICTATLVPNPDDSATGTCSPTDVAIPPGTSFTTVTATYAGDADFSGSVSAPAQSFDVSPVSGAAHRSSGVRPARRAGVRHQGHRLVAHRART